jgi:hypothetical protein
MERTLLVLKYIRRNRSLAIGLGILVFLILFTTIGSFITDDDAAYPLAGPASVPPTLRYCPPAANSRARKRTNPRPPASRPVPSRRPIHSARTGKAVTCSAWPCKGRG